ncbi:laccase domain-containing protein [Kocuria rhizophila]|uniref:polyphenol oxidase family protein n=1 Tax=Kocuria rhizophila TaxID=72000 RepID=UPI001D2E9F3C|nr:polyphenol oxidase family protein [Kocuria rhizophila]MCC5674910.1 laccase domain-containing protein [Kocuria rhizophila]
MWFRTEHDAVGVAFTSVAEGNLAAHTGDEPAEVARRRRDLERVLGSGPVRYVRQVHGTEVVDVTATDVPDTAPEADAAVSTDGTPLGILTADCLPVVLVGRGEGGPAPLLGVAHAGRRGLLDGVLQNAVHALRERGAREVTAWIGPAVCGSCYEVPEAMAQDAERSLPGIATTTSWGTPGLDLPAAARAVLEAHGVRIDPACDDRRAWCTLEHPDLFSYRRGATPGRIAGLAWPLARKEHA